jgi:hypothetical protein
MIEDEKILTKLFSIMKMTKRLTNGTRLVTSIVCHERDMAKHTLCGLKWIWIWFCGALMMP